MNANEVRTNVNEIAEVTVGVTTEGALEVTKVIAPNGQPYTIGTDWAYTKVQNVLSQLGVNIPSTGKVKTEEDGTKTLYFETTSTPQNYGTKGAIDITNY